MPPPARIDPHHPPGGAGLLGQQHAALALPGVGRRHRDGQGLRARRRPRDPRRPKAAPSRRPAWRCAGRCCVACGVGGGPGPAPGIGSGEREPAEPIPALRLGTATARAAPPAGHAGCRRAAPGRSGACTGQRQPRRGCAGRVLPTDAAVRLRVTPGLAGQRQAGVVRRGACQPARTASPGRSVRTPRRRAPASQAGRFATRQRRLAMRRRRAACLDASPATQPGHPHQTARPSACTSAQARPRPAKGRG